jgi:hypothetical protein
VKQYCSQQVSADSVWYPFWDHQLAHFRHRFTLRGTQLFASGPIIKGWYPRARGPVTKYLPRNRPRIVLCFFSDRLQEVAKSNGLTTAACTRWSQHYFRHDPNRIQQSHTLDQEWEGQLIKLKIARNFSTRRATSLNRFLGRLASRDYLISRTF